MTNLNKPLAAERKAAHAVADRLCAVQEIGAALGMPRNERAEARLAADLAATGDAALLADATLVRKLGELGTNLTSDAEHDDQAAADPSLWRHGRNGAYYRDRAARSRALVAHCIRAAGHIDWFKAFAVERGYDLANIKISDSPTEYPQETRVSVRVNGDLLACLIDWAEDACPQCGRVMRHDGGLVQRDTVLLAGNVCDGCGHDERETVCRRDWEYERAESESKCRPTR